MRIATILSAFVLAVSSTSAQTPSGSGSTAARLSSLFGQVSAAGSVALAPVEFEEMTDILEKTPPEQLLDGGLAIVTDRATRGTEPEQRFAAWALFVLGHRPDGPSLLRNSAKEIVELLGSPTESTRSLAALTLLNTGGLSGSTATRLLAIASDGTRSASDRLPAISVAIRAAPDDASVVDVVNAYMS